MWDEIPMEEILRKQTVARKSLYFENVLLHRPLGALSGVVSGMIKSPLEENPVPGNEVSSCPSSSIPMRILRILRMIMRMRMRMTKCPLFLFPSAQFPNGSAMESRHSKWYRPFILLFPKNIMTSQNIAYSYFNCPNIQQKHQMKFIFCCGLRKTDSLPFFLTFILFIVEVWKSIEPTMMKEGWSKSHQSPYYWASSQCSSNFLLPGIDFVIIFPVLMCYPPKGRNYGELLFNLLYCWYGGTDVLFLLLVNKTKHLIAFFSHSFSLHPIHFSKTQ